MRDRQGVTSGRLGLMQPASYRIRLKEFRRQFRLSPIPSGADAGPSRDLQIRHEFGQIALVFRLAGESSQRMTLPRSPAGALRIHLAKFASGHLDPRGALAHRLEIDLQRSCAIQRP